MKTVNGWKYISMQRLMQRLTLIKLTQIMKNSYLNN